MGRFEFANQQTLGQRHVVATHEAGHAVVGYFYGEQIGPIRLGLLSGGLWGGGHKHGVPGVLSTAVVFPDCVAHRLLAGEVAARRAAGLRPDRIHLSLSGAERIRCYWRVTPLAQQVLAANQNYPEDMWKVLDLARDTHRLLWWRWIWNQHTWTRMFVDEQFDFVRDLADELVRFTASTPPTARFHGHRGWAIPGSLIVGALNQSGCPVRDPFLLPTAFP